MLRERPCFNNGGGVSLTRTIDTTLSARAYRSPILPIEALDDSSLFNDLDGARIPQSRRDIGISMKAILRIICFIRRRDSNRLQTRKRHVKLLLRPRTSTATE
ncbi:hypothetical protein CCMA1212_002490 [Trichoderma ghanense]|uniref:Uncharacterized protein n=1 Tax=Trichoderma ghanense TaxID=65468 RepID=A0ABY2H9J4_9HYPO